jgi:hypothetical protein
LNLLRLIAEAGAVERIAVAAIADRPDGRHAGDDPVSLADRCSIAIRIGGVSDRLQGVPAEQTQVATAIG